MTTDAKTQGLPEMIAERIDDELVDMCHEVRPRAFRADCAALIREELLGSELVKAAEYALSGDALKGALRLRAALNELRNEGKNG